MNRVLELKSSSKLKSDKRVLRFLLEPQILDYRIKSVQREILDDLEQIPLSDPFLTKYLTYSLSLFTITLLFWEMTSKRPILSLMFLTILSPLNLAVIEIYSEQYRSLTDWIGCTSMIPSWFRSKRVFREASASTLFIFSFLMRLSFFILLLTYLLDCSIVRF